MKIILVYAWGEQMHDFHVVIVFNTSSSIELCFALQPFMLGLNIV